MSRAVTDLAATLHEHMGRRARQEMGSQADDFATVVQAGPLVLDLHHGGLLHEDVLFFAVPPETLSVEDLVVVICVDNEYVVAAKATLGSRSKVPTWPPPVVTALPSSPVDGQEVYYQTASMKTSGLMWHLRYDLSAPGSYKWIPVGGASRLFDFQAATDLNIVSTSYAVAPGGSVGPVITLPLAGDYDVTIAMASRNATFTSTTSMSYEIDQTPSGGSLAAAVDGDSVQIRQGGASGDVRPNIMGSRRKTGLGAGTVLRAHYKVDSGTGVIFNREMAAVPVRCG